MSKTITWLSNILIASFSVFAPIQSAIVAVMVLTVVDMISGIVAAHKRGEKITSGGLARTVSKILVYQIATLTAFLAQKYLILDVMPVCSLVTSLIGLTELKSVLENLDSISGGSFFSKIVDKLKSNT